MTPKGFKILGCCGYCGYPISNNCTHTKNNNTLFHLTCKESKDKGLLVPKYNKVIDGKGEGKEAHA